MDSDLLFPFILTSNVSSWQTKLKGIDIYLQDQHWTIFSCLGLGITTEFQKTRGIFNYLRKSLSLSEI